MKKHTPSSLWNDGLKLVSYCPLCETRYNPMQARLVDEDGDTHLLHVTCKKCENAILALVLVNEDGASSVGLITDLVYEDVLKFQNNREISIDDVLEMHQFLESDAWKQFAPVPVKKVRTRVKKSTK